MQWNLFPSYVLGSPGPIGIQKVWGAVCEKRTWRMEEWFSLLLVTSVALLALPQLCVGAKSETWDICKQIVLQMGYPCQNFTVRRFYVHGFLAPLFSRVLGLSRNILFGCPTVIVGMLICKTRLLHRCSWENNVPKWFNIFSKLIEKRFTCT